ncbi:MAG: patatin-like phospholipase family protein [Christensenellaceae bacterium]|jgi:NTE family protein|nr:patatin-like phospholipase family protein [Christensenellaceae bacterium]
MQKLTEIILNMLPKKSDDKVCDAVFQGGGVWNVGNAGAISVFEKEGYTFRNIGGTSSGSIIAALLASGFSSCEIKEELSKANLGSLKELAFLKNLGLFKADKLEKWVEGMLAKKNVKTFGDLRKTLKIVATDVTEKRAKRVFVMPDDLSKFGVDPNAFSVATAVRISSSIPYFFEPYIAKDSNGKTHHLVDGGLIGNYPIWLFDNGKNKTDVPVFGFRFEDSFEDLPEEIQHKKPGMLSYGKQLVATIIDVNNDRYTDTIPGDRERTVFTKTSVDGKAIEFTDFGISARALAGLYRNGVDAAQDFLSKFNFQDWQKTHRNKLNLLMQSHNQMDIETNIYL